jgi:hypothetical protein
LSPNSIDELLNKSWLVASVVMNKAFSKALLTHRALEFTRFPWKVCREAIATLFGDVLQNESFAWKHC